MGQADRTFADQEFVGNVRFSGTVSFPNGNITDSAIAPNAGIAASKLEHQHVQRHSQPNTAATAETRVIHKARSAGTLLDFEVGCITACTAGATITVDLKKNGTSVLSPTVTIDNTLAPYSVVHGALATTPYVAGDVFTLAIAISAGSGTLATGLFANLTTREAA